jgi:hypothetical protein
MGEKEIVQNFCGIISQKFATMCRVWREYEDEQKGVSSERNCAAVCS